MSKPVVVAVALGSNLGDRPSHLEHARVRLADILSNVRFSSIHETKPVDMPGQQPMFLNQAAVGTTELAPDALLTALQGIEAERERERPYPNAPRTLDLDLILYGDRVSSRSDLTVPHPRFRERSFVLGPLSEVAPDLVDPVSGLTIATLLTRLRPAREVPDR